MLKKKYWIYKDYNPEHINDLVKKLNITDTTARLLINRGITDVGQAAVFLNSTIENLYDPYLLKDMDKAVERIRYAIDHKQSIWIYGDYDVDGISSTAILIRYFRLINYPVNYYIPDRIDEGYGINIGAIEKIISQNGDLIITVDCGISAIKEVEMANELGIDIIITDHHECQAELPNAVAIINPKQEECKYPFKMPCGCGIALKLIQALMPPEMFLNHINEFIDIVSIATIADMVPLIDENRIIVKHGLGIIEKSNNLGIKMLVENCGLKGKKITSGHIGYTLAPRINAAGRISSPQNAVKLLITNDEAEAKELAKLLGEENSRRQEMESEIVEEAFTKLQLDKAYEDEKILVIYGENWHHGVIGIVASRVVEKYHKPTIILSIEEGIAKGSARSISKFNIFKALESCRDLFMKFGGHEQAAGLSLLEENVELFRRKINELANEILTEEDLIPEINCDTELPLNKINDAFIEEISSLEPYGIGNPTPQFYCINLKSKKINVLGSDGKHIKIHFSDGIKDVESIGFNMGDYASDISSNYKIGAVFTPEFNHYNNLKKIQLKLKDIKVFSNNYIPEEFTQNYYKSFRDVNDISKDITDLTPAVQYIHYYEDKDFYLRNLIYKAEGLSLIIVNTLEQAIRLYKLMEIRQRNSNKNIILSFNHMDNSPHDNTINIIINPNIDKILYKIYNNIIVYDMFFREVDFITFTREHYEGNRIVLYEKNDELSNIKQLKSITPTRAILATIYKVLRDKYNHQTVSIKDLILGIKEVYSDINSVLLKRSLTIFSEGELILDPFIQDKEDYFYISLNDQNKKINIEQLESYKAYNSFYSNFIDFKQSLLKHIEEVTRWT